jgi:hypothetical protein
MGGPNSHIIIRVKFKRSATVAEVRAANYESDDTHLRAKDDDAKTIADFLLDEVAGWWVQPDTESISLAERLQQARKRAAMHEAETDLSKGEGNAA